MEYGSQLSGDNLREALRGLLVRELKGPLDYDKFRKDLEDLYNFRSSLGGLTQEEAAAVEGLFDTVVHYSPIREERRQVPIYKGEEDVDSAIGATCRVLGIEPKSREQRV